MKIFLIDDSKTMRTIQRKVLSAVAGAEFTEAGDGAEALSILNAGASFDLMIVDWNMPNVDGLTFVRKVRETDKTTPIVMATTEAEKTRVIDALKAGVNNYVVKPFSSEALLEKVEQTLARTKAA